VLYLNNRVSPTEPTATEFDECAPLLEGGTEILYDPINQKVLVSRFNQHIIAKYI